MFLSELFNACPGLDFNYVTSKEALLIKTYMAHIVKNILKDKLTPILEDILKIDLKEVYPALKDSEMKLVKETKYGSDGFGPFYIKHNLSESYLQPEGGEFYPDDGTPLVFNSK